MSRRCVRMAVAAAAVLGMLSGAGCISHAPAPRTTAPQPVAASAGADQDWRQPVEFSGQQTGTVMAGLSCPAARSCAAVGMDRSSASGTGSGAWVPFVVNQTAGAWGPVRRIAGLADLTDGQDATFSAVSCASPGNCTAVGGYAAPGTTERTIPFAVSEVGGTWGHVTPIPGIAALTSADSAHLGTVSCLSPGNCTAAGSYVLRFSPLQKQAFVVSQVNGAWQQPLVLPGITALNTGRNAEIKSIACHGGSCIVGGYFSVTSSGASQPFVAAEKRGTWDDPAQPVRGLPVPGPHQSGKGSVNQVSCAAAGRCEAVGSYVNTAGVLEAFAVSEENDTTWHHAIVIPGTSALQGRPGGSSLLTVSCISVGNCTAGGVSFRTTRAGAARREVETAFVTTQIDFNWWNQAKGVSGLAALNKGGNAEIQSVSCGESINLSICIAAGYYTDASGSSQPLVVTQTNSVWGQAIELPGSAALNTGGHGKVNAVSCPVVVPRGCNVVGVLTSKSSQMAFGAHHD
jgi:hypothetical protein